MIKRSINHSNSRFKEAVLTFGMGSDTFFCSYLFIFLVYTKKTIINQKQQLTKNIPKLKMSIFKNVINDV